MTRLPRLPVLAAVYISILTSGSFSTHSQNSSMSTVPRRHFRVEKPGHLGAADALSIYERIKKKLARGYALSGDIVAKSYQGWRQFNHTPYLSKTHGNRYLNNYGNARAFDYDKLTSGGKLPAGAILAKDSFTVTSRRGIFAGALFIMEKLKAGASPASGDWRYVQIMPDGSLFGDSQGTGAEKMRFCHGCHAQAKKTDYLFNVPVKFRRQFFD